MADAKKSAVGVGLAALMLVVLFGLVWALSVPTKNAVNGIALNVSTQGFGESTADSVGSALPALWPIFGLLASVSLLAMAGLAYAGTGVFRFASWVVQRLARIAELTLLGVAASVPFALVGVLAWAGSKVRAGTWGTLGKWAFFLALGVAFFSGVGWLFEKWAARARRNFNAVRGAEARALEADR